MFEGLDNRGEDIEASRLGCEASVSAVRVARDSWNTTSSLAKTSHVPRRGEGSMSNFFNVARMERMNASRGRGRSLVASHTMQSVQCFPPSRKKTETAQCACPHAFRRRSSASDKAGETALYDLPLLIPNPFQSSANFRGAPEKSGGAFTDSALRGFWQRDMKGKGVDRNRRRCLRATRGRGGGARALCDPRENRRATLHCTARTATHTWLPLVSSCTH